MDIYIYVEAMDRVVGGGADTWIQLNLGRIRTSFSQSRGVDGREREMERNCCCRWTAECCCTDVGLYVSSVVSWSRSKM